MQFIANFVEVMYTTNGDLFGHQWGLLLMADRRTRRILELKKHRERVRRLHIILTLSGVFAFIVLCFVVAALLRKTAEIEIIAPNIEIMKDAEEVPELTAEVKLEKDADAVLDKEKGYTAQDFVNDLKRGKGYTLTCKADPAVEGSYQIKIALEESIQKKVEKNWKKHLKLTLTNGKFEVKNPIGTWEKDKFKKYDDTYVTNDFVESKANLYYFGEDGVKVTGWQQINNKTYFFDKDGVMQTSMWKKKGEDRYYLGKSGAAATGWKEIKKKKYYFESDGKMATGEVKVGLALYTFDDDGQVVSKKDTDIDKDKPMVALTFDDGPGKRTGELLDALEEYDAHATFFMLGQKVSQYKDEVKKMKEIGCELGNHSYDHTNLTSLGPDGVKKQMNDTNDNLKEAAGSKATLMRPPYGAINDTVKSNVGLPMILWNIDTLDWKTRNVEKTVETIMKNIGDGDIILMHDIHTETVDAAIELLPKLEDAGYQLVTVSELAAAKGKELKNGGKYTDFTK